jgi:hypothetical protein
VPLAVKEPETLFVLELKTTLSALMLEAACKVCPPPTRARSRHDP